MTRSRRIAREERYRRALGGVLIFHPRNPLAAARGETRGKQGPTIKVARLVCLAKAFLRPAESASATNPATRKHACIVPSGVLHLLSALPFQSDFLRIASQPSAPRARGNCRRQDDPLAKLRVTEIRVLRRATDLTRYIEEIANIFESRILLDRYCSVKVQL